MHTGAGSRQPARPLLTRSVLHLPTSRPLGWTRVINKYDDEVQRVHGVRGALSEIAALPGAGNCDSIELVFLPLATPENPREHGLNSSYEAGMHLPSEVERALGWYVYLYVDPRDGRIFYVGKGKHGRVLAHLGEEGEKRKHRTIREIREAGLEPTLEVLSHALPDQETAFRVEAAAIDLLGLTDLCSEVRGWQSIQFGRMGLKQLAGYYAAMPVEITDPVVLVRINRLYKHGMSVSVRRRSAARVGGVGANLAVLERVLIARRSAFRPRIAGRTAASSDPASARRRGWPDAWRRARGRRAGRRRDPRPHADSSRSASRRSPPPARRARCP